MREGRDYHVRDELEDSVDYSKRKKKNKKGLVWSEYEVVTTVSDILTKVMPAVDVRGLTAQIQDFISHPEKYDPDWNDENSIWFILGNSREQRLEIAKTLEKKMREDIRFE